MRFERIEDPSVLDARKAEPKQLSPLARRRQEQYAAFRELMGQLTDDTVVFQVPIDPEDKPHTVRQRLQRVAEQEGIDIAIRRHGNGFAVGRMTPNRRSNRGRPRTRSE